MGNNIVKTNVKNSNEEIETNQIFGSPEIERILKGSASTAKIVMKKLRRIGVGEEVQGKVCFYFRFQFY